jgi:hypothetical protein
MTDGLLRQYLIIEVAQNDAGICIGCIFVAKIEIS